MFYINMMLNRDSDAGRGVGVGGVGEALKEVTRRNESPGPGLQVTVSCISSGGSSGSICPHYSWFQPSAPTLLFLIEFDALWKLQRHKNNTLLHPSPRDLQALYRH